MTEVAVAVPRSAASRWLQEGLFLLFPLLGVGLFAYSFDDSQRGWPQVFAVLSAIIAGISGIVRIANLPEMDRRARAALAGTSLALAIATGLSSCVAYGDSWDYMQTFHAKSSEQQLIAQNWCMIHYLSDEYDDATYGCLFGLVTTRYENFRRIHPPIEAPEARAEMLRQIRAYLEKPPVSEFDGRLKAKVQTEVDDFFANKATAQREADARASMPAAVFKDASGCARSLIPSDRRNTTCS